MNSTATTMIKEFEHLDKYEKIEQHKSAIIEGDLLRFHYDNSGISENIVTAFQKIADNAGLIDALKEIQNGAACNNGLSASHYKCRLLEDSNAYQRELKRCLEFCDAVQNNSIQSIKGLPFTHVLQIGIGGSHLGPEAAHLFFDTVFTKENKEKHLSASFVSNIDPLEFKSKTKQLEPTQCLFILSSKSGNTQETLSNYELLKEWWRSNNLNEHDLSKHCVVITCKNSELDKRSTAAYRFYIDEHIGGRFSLSSVSGVCLLALCFGKEAASSFLKGAAAQDTISRNSKLTENPAALSAMISTYYRQVMHCNTQAIIGYSYALSLFHLHLQQLICESNGKNLDRQNKPISYNSSPIIFGSPGTNAQHSFFQLLHQGTENCPIEFITIDETLNDSSNTKEASNLLNANCAAQIQAFRDGDASKHIPGNKASTKITLTALNIEQFGALLSFYENKVALQGIIWNINSFDQPAVQLGKDLVKQHS